MGQTAGSFLVTLKEVFQQIFVKVKPAIDVAVPFVQQTTDAALKAAAPVANDLGTQAETALQKVGVDPKPVLDAAKVESTFLFQCDRNVCLCSPKTWLEFTVATYIW